MMAASGAPDGVAPPVTAELVEWARGLRLSDVPATVRAEARRHLLDGYGLALGALDEPSYEILARRLDATGQAEVQALGGAVSLSAESAAFLNGLGMHAVDYDDTQLASAPDRVYGLLTHPTTPVLAAAAAVADLVGASGEELLVAYVAGLEAACRIADAIAPRHYHDGFHSTGTIGPFGAAVAAGLLLGLDEDQLGIALGIAAPLGGGYRENFGTMTKPLHAGHAAHAGVMAARLAADGFTAARTILEAKRGFFAAAAGGFDAELIVGRFGDPFFLATPGVSIKPYPSGSLSHPGQDAVLALCREHDVQPAQVVSATAYTNSAMPNALIYPRPTTALEAKFSFPFCLAIAILRRRAGLAEFTDDVVTSREVQELVGRCHHVEDPAITARGFHTMETRVEIELADGRTLSRTERVATGHPDKPMPEAALRDKFAECAAGRLDADGVTRVIQLVNRLESLEEANELHRALAGTPI